MWNVTAARCGLSHPTTRTPCGGLDRLPEPAARAPPRRAPSPAAPRPLGNARRPPGSVVLPGRARWPPRHTAVPRPRTLAGPPLGLASAGRQSSVRPPSTSASGPPCSQGWCAPPPGAAEALGDDQQPKLERSSPRQRHRRPFLRRLGVFGVQSARRGRRRGFEAGFCLSVGVGRVGRCWRRLRPEQADPLGRCGRIGRRVLV